MTDGYTAVYGADETAEVSIDLIVGILSGLVSFVTLIALVFLIRILQGKKVMKF